MNRPTSPPASPGPTGGAERRRFGVMVALVAVAVAVTYQPVWTAGFIWDDDQLVTANPLIKSPGGLGDFWFTTKAHDYWPVVSTSFWIEWRLWGLNAAGYHLTNLGLHAIAAVLIGWILRRLKIPGAEIAAVLFAVHPVNVESVAWIAQRKNTLSMVFYLLSIAGYVRAEEARGPAAGRWGPPDARWWYGLSFAAFALAMLSKGSVAMLPVVLLIVIGWRRPVEWGDAWRLAPFAGLAAGLAKVNIWFQTHGWEEVVIRTAGWAERVAGAGAAFWFYLSKALWPANLMFIYPQWRIDPASPAWWLPLGAAVAGLAGLVWLVARGRARALFFAYVYFGVALVPAVGLVDVYFMKYSLVADHYQHLALAGIVALGAAAWSRWHERAGDGVRWLARAGLGAAVVALGAQTWRTARTYRDGETIYRATLERNPDCWLAHNNLGALLKDTHRDEAVGHFQAALRLKPDYAEAHGNLGHVRETQGDLPAALAHYEAAVKLGPKLREARVDLGALLRRLGRLPEAIQQLETAVRLNPDFVPARYNLGNALLQAERLDEAAAQYRAALRLQPEFGEAHSNLGNALFLGGDLAGAEQAYRAAARLRPELVQAHSNLATVLARQGRLAESLAALEAAQRLTPADPGLTARVEETRAALRAAEKR
ncbi:MAG: tetratricopeptide repeat protein [Verrucomicrobia bacterium]|nr:tetratricopeptide repeat protein [Verrucomicrobiota bacterium]